MVGAMFDAAFLVEHARAVPIGNVAARLGLQLKRQGRELVGPCPECGGRDRFAIHTIKQVWNCRGCVRGGDVIDLVQHIDRCSFQEAITTLAGRVRERGRGRDDLLNDEDRYQRASARDFRRAHDVAARIWEQASPLGPEATGYFERRGIDLDAVPAQGGLRWHPRCPWEKGTKPCVIGRYTSAIGNEPRGIWRRPLDGGKPKALGPTGGCVIRLWPDDAVDLDLVLGEGVETTLAAATRVEHRGTLMQPAWAAGSAGNMSGFLVLPGVEALTLLIDNDRSGAGQRAGEECMARWEAAGCEVTSLTPAIPEADFNDVVIK
jgi:hypothetical protein